MHRLLTYFPVVAMGLALALGLPACNDIPDFSRTPEVKITGLELIKENPSDPNDQDQIVLDLFFRDGDGDIGLTDSMKTGPFARYLPGENGRLNYAVLNPYFDNLHVSVFFWNPNTLKYDSLPPSFSLDPDSIGLQMQTRSYSSTIAPIIEPIPTRSEPIEGNIRYTMNGLFYLDFGGGYPVARPGEKFYVTVQVIDRARNVSKRIKSAEMIIP